MSTPPETTHTIEYGTVYYHTQRISRPGGIASAVCSCGQWIEFQEFARNTGGPIAERLLRARASNHLQGVE